MKLLRKLEHALLPTPGNSYRPHLLSKHTLALFLAVALVAEGFFVASMVRLNPSELFLAAAVGGFDYHVATTWVLGGLAAALAALLLTAVVRRMQVQPHDLLLPGIVVLGVVLLLLALNSLYAPPVDNVLVAPTDMQYR